MGAIPDYMIAKESAWHQVGDIVGRFLTKEELVANKNLDYPVEKHRLLAPFMDISGNKVLANSWGTFRMDKHPPQQLGTVGEGYQVIHHGNGLEAIETLFPAACGEAYFSVAGIMWEGAVFFANAKLPRNIMVGDDKTEMYLSYVTSYNGRFADTLHLTGEREVCENTIMTGLKSAKAVFKTYHTKYAEKRAQDAYKALSLIDQEILTLEEKFNFLNSRMVIPKTAALMIDYIFPKTKKQNDEKEDLENSSVQRERTIKTIGEIFQDNDKNAFPDQRFTMKSFFDSVVRYYDHEWMSNKEDKKERAQSVLFGRGQAMKERTFEVVMQAAGNAPQKGTIIYSVPQNGSFMDDIIDAKPFLEETIDATVTLN